MKEKYVICGKCGKKVKQSNAMKWVGYHNEGKEEWHCKSCAKK